MNSFTLLNMTNKLKVPPYKIKLVAYALMWGWTFGVGLSNREAMQVSGGVWGAFTKEKITLQSEEKYKRLREYFTCQPRAQERVLKIITG